MAYLPPMNEAIERCLNLYGAAEATRRKATRLDLELALAMRALSEAEMGELIERMAKLDEKHAEPNEDDKKGGE